ncbi:putative membrane protein YkoI [Gracilibacillus halotolerans]|uniref:Putative membrane protein YkoI n=1 Tax=Gracilibacillus halotolerans TaxID=74386 RepID=A0A841RJQ6_9BACI|nr:PepSY domain-containing protein [Gracilibacillus halotolerans]MBB6512739.1 putative membrane protein YkoI [Gracilibacillus halotolerans]
MKNKFFIPVLGGLIVTGGVFAALTINSDSASAELSKEEAMEKIQTQFPGEVVELEFEKEGSKKVYEIEIKGTDRHYELEVDADTGEVLKIEEEVFSGKKASKEQAGSNQAVQTADDNGDSKNTTKKTDKDSIISVSEVEAIAHDFFDGKIEELELDEDDGRLYYEVEMYSSTHEVELDIDAYTGELLSISKEKED